MCLTRKKITTVQGLEINTRKRRIDFPQISHTYKCHKPELTSSPSPSVFGDRPYLLQHGPVTWSAWRTRQLYNHPWIKNPKSQACSHPWTCCKGCTYILPGHAAIRTSIFYTYRHLYSSDEATPPEQLQGSSISAIGTQWLFIRLCAC